jgi:diguanylate cyclase (GGDEF)-like protein
MEPQIRQYADALYTKALSDARDEREKEILAFNKEAAQRGISQGLSGITLGKMIEIDAAFIGRQMKARLTSFQEALEHAGVKPSLDDLQQIWQIVEEVYETGIKTTENSLRERARRTGSPHDFGDGGVRSVAARHHDKVLGDWNVWRGRVSLGTLRQQSFSASEVTPIEKLSKKDELLADLNRLLPLSGQIGVIFIDLDNFKAVNDTMGHDAGDNCLERVAKIIGSVVLHKGRAYRYASGDEFMVVLPNVDEAEALASAERIRRTIELENPGGSVKVTASIGVILASAKSYNSAEEVLKAADQAMYESKLKKNTVSFAPGRDNLAENKMNHVQRPNYGAERKRLAHADLDRLEKLDQPWHKVLLRELLVRGQMDEAHASGFLVTKGYAQLSGALNALQYHTNLVVRDLVGQYSVNPQMREALSEALDER